MASELSKFVEDELRRKGLPVDEETADEVTDETAPLAGPVGLATSTSAHTTLMGALRVEARVKEQQSQRKFLDCQRIVCVGGGIFIVLSIFLLLVIMSKRAGPGHPGGGVPAPGGLFPDDGDYFGGEEPPEAPFGLHKSSGQEGDYDYEDAPEGAEELPWGKGEGPPPGLEVEGEEDYYDYDYRDEGKGGGGEEGGRGQEAAPPAGRPLGGGDGGDIQHHNSTSTNSTTNTTDADTTDTAPKDRRDFADTDEEAGSGGGDGETG